MNAITEIDKAGRVVVPKKLRDALHLVPGTRLTLHQEGDRLVIQPEARPRGLYMKKGTLVYDAGPLPQLDIADWIETDRNDRIDSLMGDLKKR
ncbi:AbrB family looped-hinge helix DNA binding protein [Edaphobacter lichenicola]|nr:AbrB family looped-hinge helix DNA binding protein [Edaphobacter lichenicola]